MIQWECRLYKKLTIKQVTNIWRTTNYFLFLFYWHNKGWIVVQYMKMEANFQIVTLNHGRKCCILKYDGLTIPYYLQYSCTDLWHILPNPNLVLRTKRHIRPVGTVLLVCEGLLERIHSTLEFWILYLQPNQKNTYQLPMANSPLSTLQW